MAAVIRITRVISLTARPAVFASMLILAFATVVQAQSAREWVERGHRAAAEDRHADAITAYEHAIELDGSLRTELLASLGRQYLWSDQPARAALLLEEHLIRGSECDVRSDYGLALSWSEQLARSKAVLEAVIEDCTTVANTARLRLATVQRWRNRPSHARSLYQAVIETGDAEQVRAARLGLAHADLMQDYNRRALRRFSELSGSDAEEGIALALFRLGEYERVRDYIGSGDSRSAVMRELSDLMSDRRRSEFGPETRVLRDADGTSYSALTVTARSSVGLRGRAGVTAGTWRLSGGAAEYDAGLIGADAEYRWTPTLAAQAGVRLTRVGAPDWTPVTGELNVVLTPRDALRIDAGAARLTVTDNIAAVQAQLTGRFVSLGADVRVSPSVTLASSADVTRWSAGNTRTRLRAAVRWQIEGTPRLVLTLPALVQLYDEPMPFAFFSPEQYIEAGPSAGVRLRAGDHWNIDIDGRTGGQRESGRAWSPFFTAHAALWRDVSADWHIRAEAGWSNSNLASSGSFQRTSFAIRVARRF